MAIHFRFPAAFRSVVLAPPQRIAGNNQHGLRTGVAIGRYDLIVVSFYPGLNVAVTAANIDTARVVFDTLMGRAYGHSMVSTTGSANGMPRLTWPRQPAPWVARGVTIQPYNVFVGRDEYELQCMATPAHLVQVEAACHQMLSTLTTKR